MLGSTKAAVSAGALVLLLLVSGLAGAGSTAISSPLHASRPAASSPSVTSPPVAAPTLGARLAAMNSALRAAGVPWGAIHPPDLAAEHLPTKGEAVAPTYATGPAPMGLGALGLRNVSGSLVPYDLSTASVRGEVDLTRAVAAYVDGDGPDTFGIQLNAVATNVTVGGVAGGQFWTQNFVSYTPSTENLSFGDNVWNFSLWPGLLPASTFAAYGPNGTPVPPYFYYAIGPTFHVAYPFNLTLYLNASRVGGDPAVFFNYTLNATNGTWSGSFDYVAFAAGPSRRADPLPAFEVNGTGLDPIGLPNDFELVLVGNDDGDTTTFFAIQASLSLEYWNASTGEYAAVPTAFDAGSDTGETSNGLLPSFTVPLLGGPPTATLSIGPSFVQGLWNVSGALNGVRRFSVNQRPQNAFLFVSPGTVLDPANAQWVPTLRLGANRTTFAVPAQGAYALEWMLSDREASNYSVDLLPLANTTTTLTVTLAANATRGSYTPLLAFGNSELGAVSQHGTGAPSNPYILIHRPVGGLAPEFGQLNDFGFPVFAGVLLVDTNASVRVVQPVVAITYGDWQNSTLQNLSLPRTNDLQLEFWNVTNVMLVNSTGLSGWLSVELAFFPAGAVLFWNSTGNLVANDTFYDEGVALAFYGGSNNTVWGNRFLVGSVSPWFYGGNNTTGLLEWESGDLIYNNYFGVPQPAATPESDAASCQILCLPATYTDTWNVSRAPANASRLVLGFPLTGSILRTSYQGGNYWSNYGTTENPYGRLPYNDSGLITVGGDYLPLTPSSVYAVTFLAHGLRSGVGWNVSILGVTNASVGRSVVLFEPNGSFPYVLGTPSGYLGPGNGTVVVNGTNLTLVLNFTELFAVTVTEAGLVTGSGWAWNVTFTPYLTPGVPTVVRSTGPRLTAELPNGSYLVAAAAYGYNGEVGAPSPFSVAGAPGSFTVAYTLVEMFLVQASGLASNAPWTVIVTQGGISTGLTGVGDSALAFTVLQLQPTDYTWRVFAAGYSVLTPATGSGNGTRLNSETVIFRANATAPGGPFDPLWLAVAVLGVLTVLGFALYLGERRRRSKPPAPLVAATSAPGPAAAGAAPSEPAPWEEGPADAEKAEPYGRPPK